MATLTLKKISNVVWVDQTDLQDQHKKILVLNFQIIFGQKFKAFNSIDQALKILKYKKKQRNIMVCSIKTISQFRDQIIDKQLNIYQKCIVLCRNHAQAHQLSGSQIWKQYIYEAVLQVYHIRQVVKKIDQQSPYAQLSMQQCNQIHLSKPLEPSSQDISLICIMGKSQNIQILGIEQTQVKYMTSQQILVQMVNKQKCRYVFIFNNLQLGHRLWLQNYQNLCYLIYYSAQKDTNNNFNPDCFQNCRQVSNADQLTEQLLNSKLFIPVQINTD